jgi:adenylate kinase
MVKAKMLSTSTPANHYQTTPSKALQICIIQSTQVKSAIVLLLLSCIHSTSAVQIIVPSAAPRISSDKLWGILSQEALSSFEGTPDKEVAPYKLSHVGSHVETDNSACKGKHVHVVRTDLQTHHPPKIIIMGGPASGKGTQCEHIVAKYGTIHLSTGDMLRESIQRGDTIGTSAQEYIDAGQLVPDEVMIELVLDRISQSDCQQHGWLLDGFPRTQAQAEALKKMGVKADLFIFLNVSDADLIERVTGRRSDPVTGKIYHMKLFPPPLDVVDRLVQRSDDTVDKMSKRLNLFHANFHAVRHHYKDVFVEIEGSGSPDEVASRISKAIEERVLTIRQTL